jgi:hypothetical protein
MRDPFGVPRDEIIHKATKRDVASSSLGLAGAGAGTAGLVGGVHMGNKAAAHATKAEAQWKTGKKEMRRVYRGEVGEQRGMAAHKQAYLNNAKNAGQRKMVHSEYAKHEAGLKETFRPLKEKPRGMLRSAVKTGNLARKEGKTGALIAAGGIGTGLVLGGASRLTRSKESVVAKDAFGVEVSKAFNPAEAVKGMKQARQVKRGLKMVGASNKRAIIQGARARVGMDPTGGDIKRGITTKTTGMTAVNNRRFGTPPPKTW